MGCADRACYDLSVHTKATGERLVAQVDLPQPVSLCFTARDNSNPMLKQKLFISRQKFELSGVNLE